ncbi:MAG TPA: GNAT family N-acetyltransferase [Thermoanaerobaculia bacterium]|jgi:GNAT superfamily N-acetyltransferase|nr:GNAT family N-acetyltransferase [Thermoanaerobaculia bacterium]
MTAGEAGPAEAAPAAPAGAAVSYRAAAPGDEELLYRVYASTRTEELAPVPWTEEQKDAFLRMQFRAQSLDYAANYPAAEFLVILVDAAPAGRLYLDRDAERLLIIDIALLPEHRGSGIGGGILRRLLAEAAAAAKPVHIHVERMNPALRLYQRLGFRPTGDAGIYLLMEWTPEAGGTT